MAELDYMTLQRRYGGQYVATRTGEVIASAETFDQLYDQLERPEIDRDGVVMGYVERPDESRV